MSRPPPRLGWCTSGCPCNGQDLRPGSQALHAYSGAEHPCPQQAQPSSGTRAKPAKQRCSVAYAWDGISSEGKQPWERTCRIKQTHGVSFPLFKKADQNIPCLGTLTCRVQNNLSASPMGKSQQIKNKEKPSCFYLYLSPPRQSSNIRVPAGFVLQNTTSRAAEGPAEINGVDSQTKEEAKSHHADSRAGTNATRGKRRLALLNAEGQHKPGGKLRLDEQAAVSGCTVAFQAQPR